MDLKKLDIEETLSFISLNDKSSGLIFKHNVPIIIRYIQIIFNEYEITGHFDIQGLQIKIKGDGLDREDTFSFLSSYVNDSNQVFQQESSLQENIMSMCYGLSKKLKRTNSNFLFKKESICIFIPFD